MFKLLSKCSENFCDETACILWVFLENFISAAVILDLPCSFSVQVSLPTVGWLLLIYCYIRSLVCFWTLEGFRI